MPGRHAAILLALTVLMTVLVVPPPASAVGCTTPCLVSATLDGADPGPGYKVTVLPNNPGGGEHQVLWSVTTDTDDPDLGAAARTGVWVITIDTGTVIPRVMFTHGGAVSVTRTVDGGGTYHATITANPILLTGGCDQDPWPWTCDSPASQQWDGYLDGTITDYGSWDDDAQRSAMWGMNFATNVAATSMPPEITSDATTGVDQLLIRLANAHLESDGITVFHGFVHLRIPNAFLRNAYGIDDPATLTSAGLDPELSGSGTGTVTVTPEADGTALLVDATNLTFSARTLRLHQGAIKPHRPTHLTAKRKAAHRAKLRFHASTARGSKVTGYKARCIGGSDKVLAKGHASPVKVKGLRAGVAYDCRVRATSKAGKSPWSHRVRVRRSAAA
jgi:hypothetical protein